MFDAILFHLFETNGNSCCIGISIFVNRFNELREGKKFTEVFSFFFKLTAECVPQAGHVVKRCDDDILEAYFFHLYMNNNETKMGSYGVPIYIFFVMLVSGRRVGRISGQE